MPCFATNLYQNVLLSTFGNYASGGGTGGMLKEVAAIRYSSNLLHWDFSD